MFQSPTGQSKTWWNAWKTIISQAFIFLVKHNTKNCHSVDFWGQNWIKAFFLGKLLHQHPWHTTRLRHLPEHSKRSHMNFENLLESLYIFMTSWADLEMPRSQCIFLLLLRLHSGWHGRGLILSSAACAWLGGASTKKGLQGSNSTKMISRSEMFQSPTGQSKTWWNAWKTIISQAFIFLVKHNTKNCHSVDFWGQNWIKAFFLGKLLHQHPWHTTRLRHLPEHSKWSLPELWESLRHLERILCCQEAIASPFSSSFWIPGGSAGAWSWVPLLVHESGVSIFI